MNSLDLDALRAGWNHSQRQLDTSLTLDADTLRAALRRRTGAAFRRHRGWLLASLVAAALTFVALLAFIVAHFDDAVYRLLATPLALLALAELIVDWRQWRALAALDLGAPVLRVQTTLDELRGRLLRLATWVLLSSVLLWLPLILVLVKGLTGTDLLDYLHPSVVYVNLLVGVLFVPIALLVMRWVSWRYRQRPGFERFLDDVAGSSFGKARQHFAAQHEFDRAMDAGGTAPILADHADPQLLAQVRVPLRALERRLLLALIVYLGLMLATGAFNLLHGGQPRYLVPALLLHFTWLAHMVMAILQRNQLAQWRAQCGSLATLRELLDSVIRVRARSEGWTLIATPLLALALLQVLARALAGVDALGLSGPLLATALGLLAAAATVALAWRRRIQPDRFMAPVASAISLGSLAAARGLLQALQRVLRET